MHGSLPKAQIWANFPGRRTAALVLFLPAVSASDSCHCIPSTPPQPVLSWQPLAIPSTSYSAAQPQFTHFPSSLQFQWHLGPGRQLPLLGPTLQLLDPSFWLLSHASWLGVENGSSSGGSKAGHGVVVASSVLLHGRLCRHSKVACTPNLEEALGHGAVMAVARWQQGWAPSRGDPLVASTWGRPSMHIIKRKKPIRKGYILYDTNCMTF